MNLSFWENRYINNADISIIGAGLVGLISALELRQKYPKDKIVVFERAFLGMGASTKNAGFACFGSVGEISDDLRNREETECVELIRNRWEGLQRLRRLFASDVQIGLEFNGSYEVFTNDEETKAKRLTGKLDYYNGLVEEAIGEERVFEIRKNSFGFNITDSTIFNKLEGQLDSGKLMHSLHKLCAQKDIKVIHGFELKHFAEKDGIQMEFKNGIQLQTDKLVFATNAFTKEFFPDLDVVPYRNQLIITEEIPDLNWNTTFHFKGGLGYFRNVGNRILLGGRRDVDLENENTKELGLTDVIQNHLIAFLHEQLHVHPDTKIEHRWSGILAHGNTKAPIIRSISENVHCAVRLGGMGIAIASNTAKDLAYIV